MKNTISNLKEVENNLAIQEIKDSFNYWIKILNEDLENEKIETIVHFLNLNTKELSKLAKNIN